MTQAEWEEIEAGFRAWAFHVYYKRSFKTEHDPILRFLKAMESSIQPIRDKEAVLEWHRLKKGVCRRR